VNIIFNKKITLNVDFDTETEANKEAKRHLTEEEIVKILEMGDDDIGYIYLIGLSVSDLFVVINNGIRKCVDEEWNDYFRNFIININEKNYEDSRRPVVEKTTGG